MTRANVLNGVVTKSVDGKVRSTVAELLGKRDVDLDAFGKGMRLKEARKKGLLLFRCDMNHKNAGARESIVRTTNTRSTEQLEAG